MSALTLDHNTPYTINLRRQFVDRTIIVETDYVLLLDKRRKPITRQAFVHMMWDESNVIDGVHIAFGIHKNETNLDYAGSCEYKIFKVSNDATPWENTLVKSGTLSMSSDRLFKVDLLATEAGEDLIGDTTFLVKAKIIRGLDTYEVVKYVNHMGITDYTQVLKRRINFLQLVKKDESGEPL